MNNNDIIATDDVRREESKFATHHCQFEREKQLMDKQSRAQQQITEE
jgi:hypothetical protein